jgi:hypothetical protein
VLSLKEKMLQIYGEISEYYLKRVFWQNVDFTTSSPIDGIVHNFNSSKIKDYKGKFDKIKLSSINSDL